MHTLEEYANRIGADITGLVDSWSFPVNANSIDDIPELGPMAANANTYYPQYNVTGEWGVADDSPAVIFQHKISEEVRRIEEAVRKEGFPTPDTLVIWVTDDITLVFAPVVHQAHTIIDDDGAPIDYVKEGEPFMDSSGFSSTFGGYGSMDYGIDGRWFSVLTPTKTVRGKEAETILESLTLRDSPIPISRLGRGSNPRVFYHRHDHPSGYTMGPWPRRG